MTTVSMIDVVNDKLYIHGKGLEGDDIVIFGPMGEIPILSQSDRLVITGFPSGGRYRVIFREREIYLREIATPKVDLSGIYFININKVDMIDSYHGGDYKIPDPAIRTAFIGA
jgi:hypothetical protein